MDKWVIATIVLAIILLATFGYLGYNHIVDKNYKEGLQDGYKIFYDGLMTALDNKGYFTLPIFQNNQTHQVNFYLEEQ